MEEKDNQNNWKRSQATNWLAFLSPLRFFSMHYLGQSSLAESVFETSSSSSSSFIDDSRACEKKKSWDVSCACKDFSLRERTFSHFRVAQTSNPRNLWGLKKLTGWFGGFETVKCSVGHYSVGIREAAVAASGLAELTEMHSFLAP